MNLYETFESANRALRANKVRSALTMLGVIIGVAAVILLISIGRGIQNFITDRFEALGSNLLFVTPGNRGFGRDPAEAFANNQLEEKHVKLIERYASEYIAELTPFVNLGKNAKYKTNTFQASIQAMNADGFEILNFTIDKGRSFDKNDVRTESKLVILGSEVLDALFGSTNPVDKDIKIDDTTFKVIGTFEKKGQGFDNAIVMPYTTAMSVFNVKNISNISMKVKNPKQIDIAMVQIQKSLLRDLKPDEFTILSQEDVLSSIQSILGMLTTGLGAIAGISLLVGGIGIMNIMLVSVTERTREIGLRKAVGATPSEIGVQFLIESTLLSVGGGIIGIVIGWGGSLIARNYIRTEVPWWAVALAFSFSAVVGIIFGTYPAAQASRKDPIEALRYE